MSSLSGLSTTVAPLYHAAQKTRLLSSRILFRAVSCNFSNWHEGGGHALPFYSHLSMQQKDQGNRYSRAAHTMASSLRESSSNNPGLCETADEATKGYFLQQTMYRIKDPKASLDFYSRIMGMKLLKRFDFQEMKFSLYFMGYENIGDAPQGEAERTVWTFKSKATLELTHNWGTESDPDFKGYHNGNSEPKGYGHIGITVDDLYKACDRFEKLGVQFMKRPDDGKMKGVAFIKDPDGYLIELFDLKAIVQATASGSSA